MDRRRWTVIVSKRSGTADRCARKTNAEKSARARRRSRSAGAGSAGAISRRQGRSEVRKLAPKPRNPMLAVKTLREFDNDDQ